VSSRIETLNVRAVRYIVLFGLIFGVAYFLMGVAPGIRTSLLKPYTGLLARAVTMIVNLFGSGAMAAGSLVRSERFSMDIAMGCDGVEACCFFLAGVLAFPTTWRAKLIGVGLGIPLIQVINLGRLVGLFYAGTYLPSFEEELHVYVAQTVVILLSTAVLVYWLERFAAKHR
jgi:exosortase H (IPTLxxWG-CTERM-specific)